MSMKRMLALLPLLGIFTTGTLVSLIESASASGYLHGPDPDVILYKDPGLRGQSMGVNAATDDGVPNIGFADGRGGGFETTFNDTVSSIKIVRGSWQFFDGAGYKGDTTGRLGPGTYNLGHNNDRITSVIRVAP